MQPKRHQGNVDLLKLIAEKARLEEGGEAVRKVLREVFRSGKIGTKQLAYLTQLPVPVTAAVRRELEKKGLLSRNGGASLTKAGEKFVREKLGLVYLQRLTCPNCQGRSVEIPGKYISILEKLKKYLNTRPKPLPWLDQAHGTPETALLRALFMLEKGDVEGRNILFLGDDDFTSVAVGLLKAAGEIAVVDVDARLLEAIQLVSKRENLSITCVECDLRNPFPQDLRHKYDVVFTDPPYTFAGLTLFISRGITALRLRKGAAVYLAFAHQSPRKMLIMQKALNAMGLTLVEQIPRFNTYEGAEMFANTTFLARLETTERTKPLVKEAFEGKLYTGEIVQTVRTYQCRCDELIDVGTANRFRTIEELKSRGCPKCGETRGFRLIKKQRLKEALAERLTLRNLRPADIPTIIEFEREIAKKSFPETPILEEEYHRGKLERAIRREPSSLKVALLDDEIVGWLWLRTEKDRNTGEKFGYIKSIFVTGEHRHQGFGRKLVEAATQHFLKGGILRMNLIVSNANYGAASFFDEVGFRTRYSTMRKKLRREGR